MKYFSLVVGLLTATACVPATACDEYVDYMCDCHPEEDCQTLRVIHQDGCVRLRPRLIVQGPRGAAALRSRSLG